MRKFPIFLLITTLHCLTASLMADVVINEIYYDAEPNTSCAEFIEIHNTDVSPVDISGWRFSSGITYTFPQNTSIEPGEFVVLAENTSEFGATFPTATAIGQYLGGLSNAGELIALSDAAGVIKDSVTYGTEFPWPVAANGDGLSMELINPSLDNDLAGSWRSASTVPTPAAQNSAFLSNAPPQMRQIDHSPKQPLTTESAIISVKVTDPDGIASVILEFQIVAPGAYVPAYLAHSTSTLLSSPLSENPANPAYSQNWQSIAMTSSGLDVYTAVIPAQSSRTLVRYRITATDRLGANVRVPYPDDPSLNFAYFSYDGVPDFRAETRSVTGTLPYIHPKEKLSKVPVYHLITRPADFTQAVAYDGADQIPSNNFDARSAFNWTATFVYNGKVYDNIRYRLRQRNARYSGSGKRSFRFRFNKGNYAQFHDRDGNPYPEKWRSLNSHKGATRGGNSWGLYEACNTLLWNLTGTPAPESNWFHFRVVDQTDEAPAGTNGQHLGDFYGLMLGMEDYDVRFLDSHQLERGNLYKLKSYLTNGNDVQRYQAKSAVTDASDFSNIINNLRPDKSDQWLRDYVDFDAYYRYQSIVDAVRHYDVQPNTGEHLKNRSFYFRPDATQPLGKLNVLPWDSDTSWGPNWNGGEGFVKNAIGTRPDFVRDYKNVVREMRDLIWQEDQLFLMLDHFEQRLGDIATADRDRWTGAPSGAGSQTDAPIATTTTDMKKFAFIGGSWVGGNDGSMDVISRDDNLSGLQGRDAYLDSLAADSAIPNTPTLTYTGSVNFPANNVRFQSSTFTDSQGNNTFGGMEYRVAEIEPYSNTGRPPNESLMPAKSIWNYDDLDTDRGFAEIVVGHPSFDSTNWKHPNFDDSSWPSNPGQLGFGNSPDSTITRGPVTFYFRKNITLTNVANYESILFKLLRDDGAIIYVNGQTAASDAMPTGPIGADTLASGSATGSNESTYFDHLVPAALFVEGENTIAVELHQSTIGSADAGFDLQMEGVYPEPTIERLKFEWTSDWESGELTSFVPEIAVPATALRTDRTYRARVRHLDNSGRWSHWSAPQEFTVSAPDISPYLQNLVISEFMYSPVAPNTAELLAGFEASDFEWIELRNVSDTITLDLSDVRFTKGIDADIASGTMLAPGAYALIVSNSAAFQLRYGAGLPVIATFGSGKLNNAGEQLKLSFGAGNAIRDFVYNNSAPWPQGANGTGASIILASPSSLPNHADGTNWRVGATPTPGTAGGLLTYATWAATNLPAGPNTAAGDDFDGDGVSNFSEFVFVSDASDANSIPVSSAFVDDFGNFPHLFATFRVRNDHDVLYCPEASADLIQWIEAAHQHSQTDHPDGTRTLNIRAGVPIAAENQIFLRLRASE
jgi:hypothetical protein